LPSQNGIAWWWTLDYNVMLNQFVYNNEGQRIAGDITVTSITDDTHGAGVAITHRDSYLSASGAPPCDHPVTVQIQLYEDSAVRMMYAYTGAALTDGDQCGEATLGAGLGPAEGDAGCAGGGDGTTCEAQCANISVSALVALGEGLAENNGECEVISIPVNPKNRWNGFAEGEDFSCHCPVEAMALDGSNFNSPVPMYLANASDTRTYLPVEVELPIDRAEATWSGGLKLYIGKSGDRNGWVNRLPYPGVDVQCPPGHYQDQVRIGRSQDIYFYYNYYFSAAVNDWYYYTDWNGNPYDNWRNVPARCGPDGNWALPRCDPRLCHDNNTDYPSEWGTVANDGQPAALQAVGEGVNVTACMNAPGDLAGPDVASAISTNEVCAVTCERAYTWAGPDQILGMHLYEEISVDYTCSATAAGAPGEFVAESPIRCEPLRCQVSDMNLTAAHFLADPSITSVRWGEVPELWTDSRQDFFHLNNKVEVLCQPGYWQTMVRNHSQPFGRNDMYYSYYSDTLNNPLYTRDYNDHPWNQIMDPVMARCGTDLQWHNIPQCNPAPCNRTSWPSEWSDLPITELGIFSSYLAAYHPGAVYGVDMVGEGVNISDCWDFVDIDGPAWKQRTNETCTVTCEKAWTLDENMNVVLSGGVDRFEEMSVDYTCEAHTVGLLGEYRSDRAIHCEPRRCQVSDMNLTAAHFLADPSITSVRWGSIPVFWTDSRQPYEDVTNKVEVLCLPGYWQTMVRNHSRPFGSNDMYYTYYSDTLNNPLYTRDYTDHPWNQIMDPVMARCGTDLQWHNVPQCNPAPANRTSWPSEWADIPISVSGMGSAPETLGEGVNISDCLDSLDISGPVWKQRTNETCTVTCERAYTITYAGPEVILTLGIEVYEAMSVDYTVEAHAMELAGEYRSDSAIHCEPLHCQVSDMNLNASHFLHDPSITSARWGPVPDNSDSDEARSDFSHLTNKVLVLCRPGYWQPMIYNNTEPAGPHDMYYRYYSSDPDTRSTWTDPDSSPIDPSILARLVPEYARCGDDLMWHNVPSCRPRPCNRTTLPSSWSGAGVNISSCDGIVTDEGCTVTCDAGYTGEVVDYTCQGVEMGEDPLSEFVDGVLLWSEFSGGSIECEPNLCNEGSLPVGVDSSDCSGKRYLENCSLTCLAGYNNTGAMQAPVFDCTVNGDFVGEIECIPNGIPCAASTLPSGAGVNTTACAGKSTGQNCTTFCEPGYTGDYTGSNIMLFCGGKADHSPGDFSDTFTCAANPCDASTLPVVEGVDTSSCSSLMFAETCTASCEVGFTGDSVTWSCDATGAFPGADSISCVANACDALTAEEGVDSSSCSGKTTDQSCEVSCVPGYTGESVTKTCESSGTFSGDSITCVANPCETGLPTDVGVDVSECGGATTSQTCNVVCEEGYTGSTVSYVCGASGELAPSSGPLAACEANECEASTLPSGAGVNTGDCTGKVTTEECTVQCEAGYTVVNSPTATCTASGEFTHSIECEANACVTSSLPLGVNWTSCQGTTTAGNCISRCKTGYNQSSSASFSCSSSGSFEGELSCVLTQVEVSYEEGNSTAVRELSFAVEQGAEELVEQLLDPTSEAAQAVAQSFLDAMRLPERAGCQVVHAEIMGSRRLATLLTHERRLQQSIAADIQITGVSTADIEVLDDALDGHDAASTVSAHLEQNLAQVQGIDIGSVQGVSMRPLPDDPGATVANSTNGTGYDPTYTGFLPPENGGCAQYRLFAAMVLAFRALL
jgi:hypothetical protein